MDPQSSAAATVVPRETVTLIDNSTDKRVELPLLDGTLGPKVIDIRKLYSLTGLFTYDPG